MSCKNVSYKCLIKMSHEHVLYKISHKNGVDLSSEFFPQHYGAFVSKEEAREVGGAFYLLDLVPHYTLTKIYKILSKNKLRLFPILVN